MRKTIITIVLLCVGLAVLVGGLGAWVAFAPNTPDYDEERSVKIPRAASFEAVVDSLEASDILRAKRTFSWMGKLTGWGGQVKAGHYTVESGASNYDILQKLRRGLQTPIPLTIPPGSRPEVVAAVIGRDMGEVDDDSVLALLHDPGFAADLGTDTTHLFARLLPETYSFYWLTDARTVLRRIEEHFDQFYTPAMQARADSLGLTTDEVLNLAAIIEWETGHEPEKARIAGVYLNRLQRPGWRLQADPTVQYAVMEREGRKRRLLNVDYDIQHPYNTYQIDGLPPGPITNPSKSSIRAVLNAEEHDYMYFVATGDGSHAFNRTLREHNRDARRYHDMMRERRRQQQATDGDSG